MITDSFDDQSEAKINPIGKENAPVVDACIITFSYIIEKFVLENYPCKQIAQFKFATGITPIYEIDYHNKKFAFFKTYVGAPACVGTIEDTLSEIKTNNTSYHYAPASDYIKIKNANMVEKFMQENEIPYVMGKTWTTDSFYRETINNIEKRKADGCISVEMEGSAIQAMCNFRKLEVYLFFTSGDLLVTPKWDERHKKGEIAHTQHDVGHFDIALALADYVTK